jgi:hypothetical protein
LSERDWPLLAAGHLLHEASHHLSIGAYLIHRAEIQLEVARRLLIWTQVAFFAEHDFIRESGDLSAGWRHPGQPLDGHFTLQPLHQRHEIPDRENMKLHEIAQSISRVDRIVKRMVNQRVPKRRDPFLYLLELHLPKQLVAR